MPFVLTGYGVKADGTFSLKADAIAIVPEGEYWRITNISVRFVTSATVGRRAFRIRFFEATGSYVFKYVVWPAMQPAGLVGYYETADSPPFVVAGNQTFNDAAFQSAPFTPIVLPPGYRVAWVDLSVVDWAADAANVNFQYEIYRYVAGDVQDIRVQGVVDARLQQQ